LGDLSHVPFTFSSAVFGTRGRWGVAVYVRWLRRALGEVTEAREWTWCTHSGPDRFALTPQVIQSARRKYDVVCKKLLWSPANFIRTCCIAEQDDCIARVGWWLEVRARAEELARGSASDPVKALVFERLGDIYLKLREVCPEPTEAEYRLYNAWWDTDTTYRPNENFTTRHRRRLREARETLMAPPPNNGPTAEEMRAWALDTLDLEEPYTEEALTKAYRNAAFLAHPDHVAGYGSDKAFIAVKEAYAFLRAQEL
jgi:hypothetical protein